MPLRTCWGLGLAAGALADVGEGLQRLGDGVGRQGVDVVGDGATEGAGLDELVPGEKEGVRRDVDRRGAIGYVAHS